mmetsp:Transcript_30355/g.63589  ORF Transcript_30355/g.63589 Transcript_30355/m.63589 type:complete len:240 (+) Transcript_30355:2149-2868(+)
MLSVFLFVLPLKFPFSFLVLQLFFVKFRKGNLRVFVEGAQCRSTRCGLELGVVAAAPKRIVLSGFLGLGRRRRCRYQGRRLRRLAVLHDVALVQHHCFLFLAPALGTLFLELHVQLVGRVEIPAFAGYKGLRLGPAPFEIGQGRVGFGLFDGKLPRGGCEVFVQHLGDSPGAQIVELVHDLVRSFGVVFGLGGYRWQRFEGTSRRGRGIRTPARNHDVWFSFLSLFCRWIAHTAFLGTN